MIDAKIRRYAEETGLETLVPHTVNYEWLLLLNQSTIILNSSNVNTTTIAPCDYNCKVENKKISRSRSKRIEACYLIR